MMLPPELIGPGLGSGRAVGWGMAVGTGIAVGEGRGVTMAFVVVFVVVTGVGVVVTLGPSG